MKSRTLVMITAAIITAAVLVLTAGLSLMHSSAIEENPAPAESRVPVSEVPKEEPEKAEEAEETNNTETTEKTEEIKKQHIDNVNSHITFIHRKTSTEYYNECEYTSLRQMLADTGEGLYYPTFVPADDNNLMMVAFAFGELDKATRVYKEGITRYQINHMNSAIKSFWIEVDRDTPESCAPGSEIYESHGTTFYINPYNGTLGGCYVAGVIEGNYYTFIADDAEVAKEIIDSFVKSE